MALNINVNYKDQWKGRLRLAADMDAAKRRRGARRAGALRAGSRCVPLGDGAGLAGVLGARHTAPLPADELREARASADALTTDRDDIQRVAG
jgi:hypothetical protein